MSALRQLLSALWAALWLRGRLLALRLRRLFGGRPAAGAGPNFHLATAEVPVEGVDYELFDLPAELAARLDATRAELVGVARGAVVPQARPQHPRRRRAVALVTAAVVGLAGLGAGASALVRGTTGVPAVDRLLGVYEGLDKPSASDRSGPSGSDLQPSASKASEPIKTTLPDGSKSVSTFYVARDGQICWAVADEEGDGSGALGCSPPAALVRPMRNGGYVPGVEFGPNHVIFRGYVSSDVVRLRGRGPNGPLDVQLGKPWAPMSTPTLEPLTPFVAIGLRDSQPSSDALEQQRMFQLRSYFFDAITEDGRQIRFSP